MPVLQEVLPDRKRVTTWSFLPIQPVDSDTGRNYSCVASNQADSTGKITTVTLNVHRKQLGVAARGQHPARHSRSLRPPCCGAAECFAA